MVCLVLTALPCQALDIGRAQVNSALGEPLDAHVRIHLESGEHIDDSCLSVGDYNDYPESDHALISIGVRLALLTSQNAIRISTSTPLDLPAVSMALRVRCGDGPLTVRALNLYLNPPDPIRSDPFASTGPVVSTGIESALPGTTLTVRPGDSVYGLARTIYPKSEKAVRALAIAIVLANPALFPDERPRALQIGERLRIPDLRTVEKIVADSGISPTSTLAPAAQTSAEKSATSKTTASQTAAPQVAATQANEPQATVKPVPSIAGTPGKPAKKDTVQKQKVKRSVTGVQRLATHTKGELRLKLALSIDLSPSKGMTEARRESLRKGLRPAVAISNTRNEGPGNAELTLRIARVREVQDGIDAHLTQLDSKVATLQKSVIARNQTVRPALPTAQAQPSVTAPSQVAAPSQAAAPSRAAAPLQTTSPWWQIWSWEQTKSWWQSLPRPQPTSWWPWPAAGGVALLLVGAFVFRGKRRANPAGVNYKERISSMLEEARVAATPLLGSEPALRNSDEFERPGTNSVPDHKSRYGRDNQSISDATQRSFEREAVETVIDPPIRIPDVDAPSSSTLPSPYPDIIDPGAPGGVTQDLRREMDDALDGARSMFSDVDRFIALGRTENALSLLEFQVKSDPEDRGAWVKLLAVYEQEGMEDAFESTRAAFNEQFKIS